MATDAFTNTNGTQLEAHNGNWQQGNMLASDFVIDTNAIRTPFSRNVTLFAFWGGTWNADHYSTATVTQVGSNLQGMGLCVRAVSGSAYTFIHEDSSWTLDKTVSFGVPTNLATGSRTLNANDVLYLEANGQVITASVNGTTVASVTDSTLTTGAPGIAGVGGAASGTYTLLDGWTGLELPLGVSFTAGAGTFIATDQIAGANYQRQKWAYGADGTGTDVSASTPLPITPVPLASGGATPYKLVSATGTNGASVKGSAAVVYGFVATNTNSSPRFLKFYDKASAPTVGADVPKYTVAIPRIATGSWPNGMTFTNGLAVAVTTGAADSDTGGVTAEEVVATVLYK